MKKKRTFILMLSVISLLLVTASVCIAQRGPGGGFGGMGHAGFGGMGHAGFGGLGPMGSFGHGPGLMGPMGHPGFEGHGPMVSFGHGHRPGPMVHPEFGEFRFGHGFEPRFGHGFEPRFDHRFGHGFEPRFRHRFEHEFEPEFGFWPGFESWYYPCYPGSPWWPWCQYEFGSWGLLPPPFDFHP